MSSPRQSCARCGFPLAEEAMGGLCPNCLVSRALLDDDAEEEPPGEILGQIGPYELLERIGEGGFGHVYRARQRRPVRREVAIKILKEGHDSKEVIGRFRAERQALALMTHPNIAQIHDAGETEDGRPYFAMELALGVPITQFADERELTVEERLRLFEPVCRAVHHAHGKGVIHRDLKPSNILVVDHDGAPTPKVIDFGIAKATQQVLDSATIFTLDLHLLGTPAYASPEQLLGTQEVDARADVYSLGAVLHELLVGSPAIDLTRLEGTTLGSLLEVVRRHEPMAPSATLAKDVDPARVAQERGTSATALAKTLRGDLDHVTLKCLERDRRDRYASASDLADDIDRYLRDLPVQASRPRPWDRARKWTRRHPRLVAGIAAALALGASAWLAAWGLSRTGEQAWVRSLLTSDWNSYVVMLGEDERVRRNEGALREAAGPGRPAHEVRRARLALLPRDPAQIPPLRDWLVSASPEEHRVILQRLAPADSGLIDSLRTTLQDGLAAQPARFRAAAALAASRPNDDALTQLAGDVSQWFTALKPEEAMSWSECFALWTAGVQPLRELFLRHGEQPAGLNAALLSSVILSRLQDHAGLVDLTQDAHPGQMKFLVGALGPWKDQAKPQLERLLARPFRPLPSEEEKDLSAKRSSRAGLALALLGEPESLVPHLKHRMFNEDPRLRTYLIHGFAEFGCDHRWLKAKVLDHAQVEVSVLRACMSALGDYAQLDAEKAPLLTKLEDLYRHHPDSGVHSMAAWLLREWKALEKLPPLPTGWEPTEGKNWYITPYGIYMIRVHGPVDLMSAKPATEESQTSSYQFGQDVEQHWRISRSFDISAKPISFREYERYQPGYLEKFKRREQLAENRRAVTLDHPVQAIPTDPRSKMQSLTVYQMREYCHHLSLKLGLGEEQWCHRTEDWSLVDDYPSRRGFRLPTRLEWEYSCRAGAVTRRAYGWSDAPLSVYAYHSGNSEDHSHVSGTLRPNDLGVFDALGNVMVMLEAPRAIYMEEVTKQLPLDDRAAARTGRHFIKSSGSAFGTDPERTQIPRNVSRPTDESPSAATSFRILRTTRDFFLDPAK